MLTPQTTDHPAAAPDSHPAIQSRAGQWSGRAKYPAVLALAAALILSACSKPAEKIEEVRPVRAIKLAAADVDVATEYSGEVRARVESRLGFRVGGKIVARKVDVGALVKRGQVLMQLDPQDLALAQAQAKAGLYAAESNRDLAKAELQRYQDLRAKNFVAATVLDSKQTAFKSAQASYEQAVAAYKNQSNQSGYATLTSDVDGVVTGIDAEAGQVVAAGTPVVRVAQSGDMDVVVGIPEDQVNTIRQIGDISVRLWANPKQTVPAKLRELSPIADSVTRTYTAKVAIPSATPDVKLGMTAYVTFGTKNPNPMIKLPLTALFQEKNTTSVWIVENGAVKLVPVQVAGSSGDDLLIARGVTPGQTVVTAGVNLLKPGQRVTILGETTAAPSQATAAASPAAGAAK
ncbi:MAG: efflux RND transporter periplasmic adaptor subunit [Pseudomonadota bacterium]